MIKDGWPSKVFSNRPDGSYATRDLFIKHSTIPVSSFSSCAVQVLTSRPRRQNAIKFQGRCDDTLVLVCRPTLISSILLLTIFSDQTNGEKVVPLEMESADRKSVV